VAEDLLNRGGFTALLLCIGAHQHSGMLRFHFMLFGFEGNFYRIHVCGWGGKGVDVQGPVTASLLPQGLFERLQIKAWIQAR